MSLIKAKIKQIKAKGSADALETMYLLDLIKVLSANLYDGGDVYSATDPSLNPRKRANIQENDLIQVELDFIRKHHPDILEEI